TEAAKHSLRVAQSGKTVYGSMMTTQAITVTGENVDIVAAKVRYLISKTAKLMTMKESNTLLITDYPRNIETIKRVINKIDTQNSAQMKLVTIKYAEIKALNTRLQEIAKSLFNEKVASSQVKILMDESANTLILVGNSANIKKLEAVIKDLDKERDLNEVVQIIELRNSDAKGVLATLTEIISKQTFSDPSLKPNVSASEEINAIILVGNPFILKGLTKIIDTLDKEKYQVYVQARIVEINKKDAEDVGLKYNLGGLSTSSAGLLAFSGNFGGTSALDLIPAGVTVPTLSEGLALGASLDFLQTKGASKTVSNPSILCVNNQESSIYVGKTISIVSGTTNQGTVGQTNSFKREDVGLTLKIKPRVSSSDKVTLDVETILENIIDLDTIAGQPTTTKQTVTTQAILRHGENIIIGGLVKTYVTDTETKVPVLGDIPLLGWFFTHNSTKDEQDNLIVILTPYIIDQSDKLSRLQQELGELTRLQKEYNEEVFKRIEEKSEDALTEDEEPK
ncbi:MAG TPA: hypothetical protein ENK65_00100, partial [Helicobacteraceae bacterium]|nr:hypothetical protein [Helicobacteraceae bacterium]